MSLKAQIQKVLTEAMKARDEQTKIPLRLVMAAIKEAEINQKGELTDADVLRLVQKEAKARQDTIADAEKAERPDLIEQAKAELAVLEQFLPEALSDEALEAVIRETIAEVGASSMADMGGVMKTLMPKIQGRADGGKVSQMVRQILQS
ncbi:MAG: GatB/YqeY domain-containing protein [Anaerolineales bacterium]|nr:GatB/YqeY domain-containing protein [Anaerolineales bacterium]